jgi:hypothetical protein
MERAWSPRRQGDLGEVSAIHWLVGLGAAVFVPLSHSPDYDLVADFGEGPIRVQVKSSTCRAKGRFVVALCTRGGNQSWNGVIKLLDASRCDSLFVHVGDGRRWFIPVSELGGGSAIVLGGPKYAEFEIAPGEPIAGREGSQAGPFRPPARTR